MQAELLKEKFISSRNNPNKSYNVLIEVLGRQTRNNEISEKIVSGHTIKSKVEFANTFNEYLSGIATS